MIWIKKYHPSRLAMLQLLISISLDQSSINFVVHEFNHDVYIFMAGSYRSWGGSRACWPCWQPCSSCRRCWRAAGRSLRWARSCRPCGRRWRQHWPRAFTAEPPRSHSLCPCSACSGCWICPLPTAFRCCRAVAYPRTSAGLKHK